MGMLRDSIVGFWHILRAMGLTLKFFFTKPVTVQYPEEPVRLYPRFRGRHELRCYMDGPYAGLERCIGCALCAAYCPTQCIYVQAGENKDGVQRSPGERYAEIYEINLLRCMFCGYCEEACPTGAIVLRREFALADYSRGSLIFSQERLLEPAKPHAIILDDQGDTEGTTRERSGTGKE
jgi:NADH-quinone oxidoreductase subunit I